MFKRGEGALQRLVLLPQLRAAVRHRAIAQTGVRPRAADERAAQNPATHGSHLFESRQIRCMDFAKINLPDNDAQ